MRLRGDNNRDVGAFMKEEVLVDCFFSCILPFALCLFMSLLQKQVADVATRQRVSALYAAAFRSKPLAVPQQANTISSAGVKSSAPIIIASVSSSTLISFD